MKKTKLSQQFLEEKIADVLSPLIDAQKERARILGENQGGLNTQKLYQLLQQSSNSILTTSNDIQVMQNGSQKFPQLLQDLEGAQESIHMEYFIWRSDGLNGTD